MSPHASATSFSHIITAYVVNTKVIDREPIGLSLVGKLTNFHAHSSIPHASLYQEIDVCQAVTGGCCQGGHENETPELS